MTGAARTERILLTGWFSFRHGEVTAGDLLALQSVSSALQAAGLRCETAWSEVFRPGGLRLEEARRRRCLVGLVPVVKGHRAAQVAAARPDNDMHTAGHGSATMRLRPEVATLGPG